MMNEMVPIPVLRGWLPPLDVVRVSQQLGVFIARSRSLDAQGNPIDNGLFDLAGHRRRGTIAEYVGELITRRQYLRLVARHAEAANYCLEHENGRYLCCWEAYRAGRCWASAANSPVGLRDDLRQRSPLWVQDLTGDERMQPNAVMVGGIRRGEHGEEYCIELVALRDILPGEEILVRYSRDVNRVYAEV